jgi:NAD(P)-dependent dehydrogenase (short-subunit alcohol dehydrogenase family)
MKTVLITGASSGIGLQLARDYQCDGWQVIACGRDQARLQLELPDLNGEYRVFDTTDREHTKTALQDLSHLDLVILNAGACEYIDDARHFDAEVFEHVVNTNLLGTANCLAALLPNMQHGSRIAIVSSSVTFLPLTRAEAYGASKAALDYLGRTLAVDLEKYGIGVSIVRPGFVDTPLTRRNDFPMPGRITSAEASLFIRAGLNRGKPEINFPFLFILSMRLLSWLPHGLWHRIAVGMTRENA